MAAEDAERLRADAAAARAEAEQLVEAIARLEAASDAYAAWVTHIAVTRDNAERSGFKLRCRGVDPDAAEDRVTAAEWLDEQRTEQADAERERPVREEYEIDDHERPDEVSSPTGARAVDEPIDADVPDIREASVHDPTETADPAVRRRVPTLDETTAAVARAQSALAEITNRQAADTARAEQDAADRAAAEAARQDELGRWSTDDAAAAETVDDAGHEDLVRES